MMVSKIRLRRSRSLERMQEDVEQTRRSRKVGRARGCFSLLFLSGMSDTDEQSGELR